MPDPMRTFEVVVKATADEAAAAVAARLKRIVGDAVAERGICSAALAGGTTPRGLYGILARTGTSGEIPWQNVEVFLSDERDVPQDHPDSNFGMIQRTLLDHVPIDLARVHPMPADADDLAPSAATYEQTVRDVVPAGPEGLPRFDLILLGMGGDGHVASLYPGTEALGETDKLVTACPVPVLGRRRMTFTYPLINAARNVILLVTGDDKAPAVATLLGDDDHAKAKLPAACVAPTDGAYYMVLDAPAARDTDLKPQ